MSDGFCPGTGYFCEHFDAVGLIAADITRAVLFKMAALKERIDKFIKDQESEIKKKDKIELVYIPKKGVIVKKNGKELNTTKGLDFKKALFAIWIGDEPAQDDLKEGMLGK